MFGVQQRSLNTLYSFHDSKHEDDLTLEHQFINVPKKLTIVKYLDTGSRVPLLIVYIKVSSFDGQSSSCFSWFSFFVLNDLNLLIKSFRHSITKILLMSFFLGRTLYYNLSFSLPLTSFCFFVIKTTSHTINKITIARMAITKLDSIPIIPIIPRYLKRYN